MYCKAEVDFTPGLTSISRFRTGLIGEKIFHGEFTHFYSNKEAINLGVVMSIISMVMNAAGFGLAAKTKDESRRYILNIRKCKISHLVPVLSVISLSQIVQMNDIIQLITESNASVSRKLKRI